MSHATFPRARLGLDFRVRQTHLTGGVVSVSLRPVIPEGQASLGGVQPITVWIQIDTETANGGTRTIVGPIDVDLRPDVEELRPPVYLPEGLGLRVGQELRLRATDKETGNDLGTIPLTMDVDFE